MNEICAFGKTDVSKNNYRQAERILKTTNNFFLCGKDAETPDNDSVKITAKCIKTSAVRDKVPHEIVGEIKKDGKIVSMVCTCVAGAGEQCKHVVATLLYCYE